MLERSLAQHQQAFAQVCFRAQPPDAALETLGANRERWLLYRHMVRTRLRNMLRNGMKRSAALMGDQTYGLWFDAWLEHAPPTTRYIREIVPEFTAFALPRAEQDASLTSWQRDLLRYEAAKWEMAYLDTPVVEASEFAFEKVPALNPALKLLKLDHRVQDSSLDDRPAERDQPAAEPVHLCVFRNPETHKVVTWELKPRAAALVRTFQAGKLTATQAGMQLAADHKITIDAQFVETIGATLADLLQAGMLLGSRP